MFVFQKAPSRWGLFWSSHLTFQQAPLQHFLHIPQPCFLDFALVLVTIGHTISFSYFFPSLSSFPLLKWSSGKAGLFVSFRSVPYLQVLQRRYSVKTLVRWTSKVTRMDNSQCREQSSVSLWKSHLCKCENRGTSKKVKLVRRSDLLVTNSLSSLLSF